MSKLKRVEFMGGPLDGKWVSVPTGTYHYTYSLNPLATHVYVADEQYTGNSVRLVFRHNSVEAGSKEKQ